jgi:predicted metal-binding protein
MGTALMRDKRISALLDFASSLGVSDAKVMRVDRLRVEDRFRGLCREPRCPMYGTSVNCPPHSPAPAEFREYIREYGAVLAFKFDMPLEGVGETGIREAGLLVHETTAAIEHEAVASGFERARGHSSGGCKETLCREHSHCAVIEEGGPCRHPDIARPSLSGMGVNWLVLSKSLGWEMGRGEDGEPDSRTGAVLMGGLVFLE